MDDHIRKLDTKIRSNETELNALYTKIQKLDEEIATLHHKKLISKNLETAEMSLTGVLKAIFETEEDDKQNICFKGKDIAQILGYSEQLTRP